MEVSSSSRVVRHRSRTYLVVLEKTLACSGFHDQACYRFYLSHLFNSLRYFQVTLHAYLLLPERIFLLATPRSLSGLVELTATVDRSYSDYFDTRFARTAGLWSRHRRIVPITREELVLECQKYIEREPLRIQLVSHPGAWQWSSYCSNAFGVNTKHLVRHPAFTDYLHMADNSFRRYRDFVAVPFSEPHYHYLQNRVERGLALPGKGSERVTGAIFPRKIRVSRGVGRHP